MSPVDSQENAACNRVVVCDKRILLHCSAALLHSQATATTTKMRRAWTFLRLGVREDSGSGGGRGRGVRTRFARSPAWLRRRVMAKGRVRHYQEGIRGSENEGATGIIADWTAQVFPRKLGALNQRSLNLSFDLLRCQFRLRESSNFRRRGSSFIGGRIRLS